MTIKLKFCGGVGTVTGSRYFLDNGNLKMFVDCGLCQEWHCKARNWRPFEVPPPSVKAVLLTHAHVDHCGLLPKLVKDGFSGKIYCTTATAKIAAIALLDSAKIQEEDAAFKKKRHEREGRKGPYPEIPLYTLEDAESTIPLFEAVRYGERVPLNGEVEAFFHDAGHILGASLIELRLTINGNRRTILFSGDIGRRNRPIIEDPSQIESADYVIVESTYGDRLHEDPNLIPDQLADVINSTVRAGGNIVVPAFAIERAQEILYTLNELLIQGRIPRLMVFLDSPMAARVTQVFKEHPELYDQEMRGRIREGHSPFEFPGLVTIQSVEDSKAINNLKGTCMIIAGSGMASGGRVKHHLVANISRPESTILFVGYQSPGTLGRQIVDGAKEVRILGQMRPVRARVVQLGGFSAHADRDELMVWLGRLKRAPRHVFVTHGEEPVSKAFAEYLRARTGWNVSVPQYMDEVILD